MHETSAGRVIQGEVTVDAPVSEVWATWTTEQGIKSFFAPDCNIELRVDGPFEMFFFLDGEPGRRGGEWDEAFAYFERAWLEIVLPNLAKLFSGGEER
ncbi:MAG: SRPBCC domain-containing protein [Candidatus Eisenbacteria bacterium]